jgi:hypothetical protein
MRAAQRPRQRGIRGCGVSMARDRSGRAGAAQSRFAWFPGLVALACAPLLAGCATEAQHRSYGATIAFESIDGPPRPVFDRLVTYLDAEARVRQVAMVSREAPARYRVRAYLIAKIEPRRTTIAWVWDVYDSDLQRAIRIAGEEAAGRRRKDAWTAAEDGILGRIAEAGIKQLAAFAAGPGTAPSEAPPARPADPPGAAPEGEVRVAAATRRLAPGRVDGE